MTDSTLQRLQEVFRAALELPPDAGVSHLHRESASNWDSVAHVLLVSGLENEFGVTIDTSDSLRVDSFDMARTVLAERGVA